MCSANAVFVRGNILNQSRLWVCIVNNAKIKTDNWDTIMSVLKQLRRPLVLQCDSERSKWFGYF